MKERSFLDDAERQTRRKAMHGAKHLAGYPAMAGYVLLHLHSPSFSTHPCSQGLEDTSVPLLYPGSPGLGVWASLEHREMFVRGRDLSPENCSAPEGATQNFKDKQCSSACATPDF